MNKEDFESFYIPRLIGIFKEESINTHESAVKSINQMVNSKRMLELYLENKSEIITGVGG